VDELCAVNFLKCPSVLLHGWLGDWKGVWPVKHICHLSSDVPFWLKGGRAKLEGPRRVEFLGRGCFPPHQLEVLGERCKLTQWDLG